MAHSYDTYDDISYAVVDVNSLAEAYVSDPSDTSARQLAEAMQPMLRTLAATARRRDRANPAATARPMEEYMSDANAAAWECLQTFDPSKGPFTRFALHTVSRELGKRGLESRSGVISISSQTLGRAAQDDRDTLRSKSVSRAVRGRVSILPGSRPNGHNDPTAVYDDYLPALDDFASSHALAHDIREAFTELRERNERYAHYLYLSIYEGLSVAEVAEHEGVTDNTAKLVIRRARAAFKKIAVARGLDEML